MKPVFGILTAAFVGFSPGALGSDTTLYVLSLQAPLRSEPKLSATTTGTLKRGDSLERLGERPGWVEVRRQRLRGWLPKTFVSRYAPIGASELAKLPTGTTLEKASRRRPASFSVTASTRGLMVSERSRKGQERYPADYEALTQLERREASSSAVEAFRKQGHLPD